MTKHGKPTILIVDDIPLNIKILAEALKPHYRVLFATQGPEALRIASGEDPPALILLDASLPGMGGLEVCRRLKEDPRAGDIPTLFILPGDAEEDARAGLAAGAAAIIRKPFALPLVKAKVKAHIEISRQQELLRDPSALDRVTGIAGRRHFDEYLRQQWRLAEREGVLISLILMDLDFFQAFFERYGPAASDDCLRRVARTLAAAAKGPADAAARYAHCEFALLLRPGDAVEAAACAEELRRAVEDLRIDHVYSPVSERLTATLGAASLTPSAKASPELLLETVRALLDQAKRQGRNRVEFLSL